MIIVKVQKCFMFSSQKFVRQRINVGCRAQTVSNNKCLDKNLRNQLSIVFYRYGCKASARSNFITNDILPNVSRRVLQLVQEVGCCVLQLQQIFSLIQNKAFFVGI